MFTLGPIGFAAPGLLLALVALPVLWWLLRAVPPAPVIRRFPGVALLLGLTDERPETDKTPWWLLLLRALAVAALILAFAGPVLNPQPRTAGSGPLLILTDGGWADAGDWARRQDRIAAAVAEAGRAGRPVAVVLLTDLPDATELPFRSAEFWSERLTGLTPNPWAPDDAAVADWAAGLPADPVETLWLSDGLQRDGRAPLLEALRARGPVTVFESPRSLFAVRPPAHAEDGIAVAVLRAAEGPETALTVSAFGPDPSGVERELARATAAFDAGATEAEAVFSLQPELRNRITRFQVAGQRSAGAVALTDDALQRRKVALLSAREDREGLELLQPLHFLRNALEPVADLIDGSIDDVLLAGPHVIVLADIARVTEIEADMLTEWMEKGGLLLRFAGPRLAGSDVGRGALDALMPVRLRAGGRTVGGAMSWGAPRQLREFDQDSPFAGLSVPADVSVTAQVLAQPDPELAERTIATLADGTPLVTRRAIGQGQVVLFHVTANAEWSSLPLSGLFVQMLERLAVSTRPARPDAAALEGTVWTAERLLDPFGAVVDAGRMAGVPGPALAEGRVSAAVPPGVYAEGGRRLAMNVLTPDDVLAPTAWPADIPVEGLQAVPERALAGPLLLLALAALLVDIVAALWLSGRLRAPSAAGRAAAVAALGLTLALGGPAGGLRAEIG